MSWLFICSPVLLGSQDLSRSLTSFADEVCSLVVFVFEMDITICLKEYHRHSSKTCALLKAKLLSTFQTKIGFSQIFLNTLSRYCFYKQTKDHLSAVNLVFLFLFQADEGEEVPGSTQKHRFLSLHRDTEEADQQSMPSFDHSSTFSDIISQHQEIKPPNICSQTSFKPPRPHAPNPPGSSFDHRFLESHIQQTELFRQFCQELVTIHRNMTDNMHTISQSVSDLSGQVSQMCQTLTKIKDELQSLNNSQVCNASQEINLQTTASKVALEPKTEINQSHLKQTPIARVTRSRKRKQHF